MDSTQLKKFGVPIKAEEQIIVYIIPFFPLSQWALGCVLCNTQAVISDQIRTFGCHIYCNNLMGHTGGKTWWYMPTQIQWFKCVLQFGTNNFQCIFSSVLEMNFSTLLPVLEVPRSGFFSERRLFKVVDSSKVSFFPPLLRRNPGFLCCTLTQKGNCFHINP